MQTLRQRLALTGLIFIVCACANSPTEAAKKRNPSARKAFMLTSPCPSTNKFKGACPGYVVDHIVPIKRGGGDHPYNMQWQTLQESKQKDRWE